MVAVAYSQPPEPSGPHTLHLHFGSGVSGTTGTTRAGGILDGRASPHRDATQRLPLGELGHQMEQVAKVSVRLAPPKQLSPRNSHPVGTPLRCLHARRRW
jgi:hypothetical protein